MTTEVQTSWKETARFVAQWLARGEVAESCRRLKVDKSFATRMLKGKTTYPNFDLLADLKAKAENNYKRTALTK